MNRKTDILKGVAAVGMLGSVAVAAWAAPGERPDTSAWVCERCPFADGLTGEVAAGPGYVSNDHADFGNFGGLEDQGVFLALDGELWYRQADGRYVLAYGERLGLDSRLLAVEGGQQGLYRLALQWQEIPWVGPLDGQSVFLGAGTADQTLPAEWINPGNTADMPLLRPNLRSIDLGHQREILSLGAAVATASPWRYRVDVEHTRRKGNFSLGASFLFTGTELVVPLDEETTLIEAAIGYVRDRWQLEAAYQVSLFDNSITSVRWDNPFLAVRDGDRGEIAGAPDNAFHQFVMTGFWSPGRSFNMAGQVAVGRASQDEVFLAPTLNANLQVPPLPVASLDGQVNTRIANLRMNGHFTDRLRGRLVLRYDERDNATDQYFFPNVVTDTFVVGGFFNKPYSYKRRSGEAGLDYRFSRQLSVAASARRQVTDRDLLEVSEATTDVVSLGLRGNPDERLTLSALASREQRTNDLDPALIDPRDNPGLRRFHFAERDRDLVRFAADYAFSQRYSAGVFVEFADENYTDTLIGLSSANDRILGVDLSATFGRQISASAFVAHERLQAEIFGADDVVGEPWRAVTDDEFLTAGLNVEFLQLPGRWRNGTLRFTYARADGEIEIERRGDVPPFPDLQTRRFLFEADVERELSDRFSLALGYIAARARADDFFRDRVEVDTMPNYIALGTRSPDRTVHVIRMLLRYRFD